jgi:hypothetical protein
MAFGQHQLGRRFNSVKSLAQEAFEHALTFSVFSML